MRFLFPLFWALHQLNFANEDFLTAHGPEYCKEAAVGRNASVAIIGAGFAGLSAFGRFAELGFTNMHLFEASERLGGRVFPVEFDGVFLQHGAEFINGRHNPIFAMAHRLRLIVGEVDDAQLLTPADGALLAFASPDCAVPPDKVARFTRFSAELEARYARMAAASSSSASTSLLLNVTIGELFARDYDAFLGANASSAEDRKHFDALARMYRSYYEAEWSAPVDKLALHNYANWQDTPQQSIADAASYSSYTLNAQGYARILEELSENIAPERLHMASRVLNIDYGQPENGIRLLLNTSIGPMEWPDHFDFVLVTVPIGHLKRFAPAMFTPPLPRDKLEMFDAIGFGAMQKVFLVYQKPFWPLNMASLVTLSCEDDGSESYSSAVLRTIQPHPWKANVLVVWLSGNGPRVVNAMDDQQLGDLVTDHLRKLLPNATAAEIPRPHRIIRMRWADDELFLGSYTYITPEASVLSADPLALLARPVRDQAGVPRVLFAGEGTHSTMYQTTIGAFLSGQREADRVAEHLRIDSPECVLPKPEGMMPDTEGLSPESEGMMPDPECLLPETEGMMPNPECLLPKPERMMSDPEGLSQEPERMITEDIPEPGHMPDPESMIPEHMVSDPEGSLDICGRK